MKILSFLKNLFSKKKVEDTKVEKVEELTVNWEAVVETKVEEPVVEEPVVEEPVVEPVVEIFETAKDIKSGVKSGAEKSKRKYTKKVKSVEEAAKDGTSPEVPVTKPKRKYNNRKK